MPSPPLPPARRARARAALACLTPPHPAGPPAGLLTGQTWPGRRGFGAPPPPGPARWLGGGEEEAGGSSLASLEGAAALGRGGSGSSSSSPSQPPLPPLYLRGTQAEGGGARTRPGDNCQLEAPLGGGVVGGWEGQREGGGHSGSPRPARLGRAVEIGKERGTVAIHGAHAY